MNIRTFARGALTTLAATVALCAGPLAHGTTVTLDPTGWANGDWPLDFTSEPFSPVSSGAFAGTVDGNPIVFFCFELTQTFSFNPPPPLYYQYDDTVMSGGQYDLLSELFTEGFGTWMTSTDYSVGFQLAVWEILKDPTPASVSNGNGSFYVTNDYGHSGAVTRANDLLAGLPSSGLYQVHLLQNNYHQDFVYATLPLHQEVPEPAPLTLIGAAMVALFVMRRRMVATRND